MADLRLAPSLLAYLLAVLASAELSSRVVHSTINFFSPEGSLVFGLAFGLLVALLTALFQRLEGRAVVLGAAREPGAARALASGAMLGAAAYAVVVLAQWALGYVVVGGIQAGRRPSNMFLASLVRNPGVAFAEELAFRGQVLGRLSERVGFGMAAVLSSLLYAGCHFGVDGFSATAFVGLTVLGLLLAGLVHRTGALWASMGFHAAWNIAQSGLFGLSMLDGDGHGKGLLALKQRGPVALVGAGHLTEGGLITMAVLTACTVLVFRSRREVQSPAGIG